MRKSAVLKLCLFATGLAGIVAEFVLSTLASYLLGDSIFQWSLIISLMLFAMGMGSYLTRFIRSHLLDKFIFTEFTLSVFCSVSAGVTYWVAAYTQQVNLLIYLLALIIGVLIGLEIPLVTRINESYEELRINISAVMQYDYIGALVGGLFFSFLALPKLGLTYTPVILGIINFLVALILFWKFSALTHYRRWITAFAIAVSLFLLGLLGVIKPIILFSEQRQYKDKIILEKQSVYQKIIVTQWKDNYWLFINRNLQFSSYDEWLYHEPLVHPAMKLHPSPQNILVLGGGDGLAVREILKFDAVRQITLVDLDPAMTDLGQFYPVFLRLNFGSLNDPRVKIVNLDAFQFLRQDSLLYDVIIIDLPDPNTVELSKLYSLNFYRAAWQHLGRHGTLVTQAADVSQATQSFACIWKTMEAAGFSCLPYRNYVPTMGNWGWILGIKSDWLNAVALKEKVSEIEFDRIPTRFLNRDAMLSMLNFGKGLREVKDQVVVNTELNPVLYRYYASAYELAK
jgi:spermidine synthase